MAYIGILKRKGHNRGVSVYNVSKSGPIPARVRISRRLFMIRLRALTALFLTILANRQLVKQMQMVDEFPGKVDLYSHFQKAP